MWSGARVERTNARGRHSYCAPSKTWIIEQAMEPRMSMAGVAMRSQVQHLALRDAAVAQAARLHDAPILMGLAVLFWVAGGAGTCTSL